MFSLSLASRKHPTNERPTKPMRPIARTVSTLSANPTILLVDDDSAVRESLGRVLTTEGWRVVEAASGEQALERLAEQPPDLMITDLRMAEVSGWDLLFHENLHRPHLPIFVITALPPPAAGGADQFAAQFFQKPLDLDSLVLAIRRCLGTGRPFLAKK
jgi:two-component system response regulator GlrR